MNKKVFKKFGFLSLYVVYLKTENKNIKKINIH